MKKIKRLTPEVLKQIIAEEKEAIIKEQAEKQKIVSDFKMLNALKKKQSKKLNEVIRLFEARKKLKHLITKRS